MPAKPEAETRTETVILEELAWELPCDIGRGLIRMDGLPPCDRPARYTANVHRCSTPGEGKAVLLCMTDLAGYLEAARKVSLYPHGEATCSYCGLPMTPREVVHNVCPL